jgi:hypothetical protein
VVLRAEVVLHVGGVLEPRVALCAEFVLVAIVFLELLIVVEYLDGVRTGNAKRRLTLARGGSLTLRHILQAW